MAEDLTFEQVNSLMNAKFEENEINGEKLMQMNIDKFAEVIGIDLILKYPQHALHLFNQITYLQTKPFECKICLKHYATSRGLMVHQCTHEKSSA